VPPEFRILGEPPGAAERSGAGVKVPISTLGQPPSAQGFRLPELRFVPKHGRMTILVHGTLSSGRIFFENPLVYVAAEPAVNVAAFKLVT
jgi:hypothetical protein